MPGCESNVYFLELIRERVQTHRSEARLRAFWGHRGFSRGHSQSVRRVERCCPVVERVKVQNEASKNHIWPGQRYIYSLCFKLHQILIIAPCNWDELNHDIRPDISNTMTPSDLVADQ